MFVRKLIIAVSVAFLLPATVSLAQTSAPQVEDLVTVVYRREVQNVAP